MKKCIVILIIVLMGGISECMAQNSGLGFNYQAVVRKANGVLLSNSDVTLRISLYPGQSSTSPTWVETHKVHTDSSGSFGITVGKGSREGNSVAAQFKDVNFASVYYWLKIEILDGSSYREVSFAQLPSSPYAEVAHNAAMFAGMIVPFAGPVDPVENIPSGWLLCDGSAVSRSEYFNLYKAIGNSWGEGDGNSTFNLPDLRGMFLRGVSGDSGNDEDAESRTMLTSNGGNTGNNVGSYQGDAIRNITGGFVSAWNGGYIDGAFYFDGSSGAGQPAIEYSPSGVWFAKFDASRSVGAEHVGSDNRPKNVYVNYLIKY